jgi:hypothetical protein
MTQAFLFVVRALAVALIGYWGYRLWTGTRSWTSRVLGVILSAVLIWQVTGGTWTVGA